MMTDRLHVCSITIGRFFESTFVAGVDEHLSDLPTHRRVDGDRIFIASITSSRSPRLTLAPTSTEIAVTAPGIGAPTWPALPGSAFARISSLPFSDASRTTSHPVLVREYFDMATMLRQLGVNPQILTASS